VHKTHETGYYFLLNSSCCCSNGCWFIISLYLGSKQKVRFSYREQILPSDIDLWSSNWKIISYKHSTLKLLCWSTESNKKLMFLFFWKLMNPNFITYALVDVCKKTKSSYTAKRVGKKRVGRDV
jgi:hypothetical protein